MPRLLGYRVRVFSGADEVIDGGALEGIDRTAEAPVESLRLRRAWGELVADI